MEVNEYSEELISWLQPGNTVRVFYGDKHIKNQLRHIRAVVDDEYIVYRVWSKSRWRYYIDWIYGFYLAYEKGALSLADSNPLDESGLDRLLAKYENLLLNNDPLVSGVEDDFYNGAVSSLRELKGREDIAVDG